MKNRIIEIAVTDLATKLDEARRAANDIEETAPQSGVYGDISDALRKTLAVLRDGDHVRADAVYEAILDGSAVKEALAIEAKSHAAKEAEQGTRLGRIRKALEVLNQHGVTETQVQISSGLSYDRWVEITSTSGDEPRMRVRELHQMAAALVLHPIFLSDGDPDFEPKYSPSTLAAIIAGQYPASA